MLNLANRVQHVKPSPTIAVATKARVLRNEGRDIISLGIGEPDFDTPEHIKQAGIDAIREGFTKYTPVDGIPDLKAAIINKFKRDNQLNYEADQIIVSVGAKQGIFNLCQALLSAGDEVIIPAPYWVSYPDIVRLANATPVIVSSTADMHYKITPEQLEKAITKKTKLLILNSPSNPSGVAYTKSELQALGEVLNKHPEIFILTDDIYEHILWSGPFVNILNACPSLYDRTVVLNGVSKAYAMTGWRIGYSAGPASIIKTMKIIQSQSTSGACSIAQKASVAALNGDQSIVAHMVKAFHERHDYVFGRLSALSDVHVTPADGTFYLFPNVKANIERLGLPDDIAFAEKLLEKEGLALVPGTAFGTPGAVRISYATDVETLRDAMDRLERFMNK